MLKRVAKLLFHPRFEILHHFCQSLCETWTKKLTVCRKTGHIQLHLLFIIWQKSNCYYIFTLACIITHCEMFLVHWTAPTFREVLRSESLLPFHRSCSIISGRWGLSVTHTTVWWAHSEGLKVKSDGLLPPAPLSFFSTTGIVTAYREFRPALYLESHSSWVFSY